MQTPAIATSRPMIPHYTTQEATVSVIATMMTSTMTTIMITNIIITMSTPETRVKVTRLDITSTHISPRPRDYTTGPCTRKRTTTVCAGAEAQ